MNQFLHKLISLYYVVALLIIAGFTIVSYVIVDKTIRVNNEMNILINLKRIVSQALEYERGNKEALTDLKKIFRQFVSSQRTLLSEQSLVT